MPESFVRGADALERLLRQLPEKVARNVTANGLRAGGRVLVKGIKARAPRGETGNLAKSPTVSSSVKVTRGRGLVAVGFKKPTSRRVHLTEFGTEHSAAEPFIRPTLEQDGAAAIKAIGQSMGRGVEREARKMAKR